MGLKELLLGRRSAAQGSSIRLADGPREGADAQIYQALGTSGNIFGRGFIQTAEYVQDLTGPTGAGIYQKMRSDAQVEATERLITLPIRSASWDLHAWKQSDDPEDKEEVPEIRAFLEEALRKRINFDRLLDHLLLAWPFGFEVMEKVYAADSGKIWYSGIYHRRQSTIQQWHGQDGELAGIEQFTWKDGGYRTVTIPEEPDPALARLKLVHCTMEQEGDNWEGRSGLRASYGPWYWKTELIKISLIGYERFAIGIPRGKIKQNYSSGLSTTLQGILRNLRSGDSSFILETEDMSIDIAGHPSQSRYNPQEFIEYCDEMIAMSALAMALKLGSTQTGSRALGATMFEMFLLGLEAIANQIQAVINDQIIAPLVALNFGDVSDLDVGVQWADLKPEDLGGLADVLSKLGPSGFVTADDKTEARIRERAGLPPKEVEDLEEEPEPPEPPEPPGLPQEPQAAPGDEDAQEDGGTSDIKASAAGAGKGKALAMAPRYWRELRPEERVLSLAEIDGRQDDAQDHLVGLLAEDRAVWARALRDQIELALADGDPSDLGDIQIPREAARRSLPDVTVTQRDLFAFGRRMVKEELKREAQLARRQAMELRDEPLDTPEMMQLRKVRALKFLDGLASRAQSVAVERSLDILRTRGVDFTEEDLQAIEEQIVSTFDAATRKAAAPLVSEAFNLGRDAEARAEGVDRAIYSAILDDDLCEECAKFDGQEYELNSQEYWSDSPPNPQCLSTLGGENACRCLWIYVLSSEQRPRG